MTYINRQQLAAILGCDPRTTYDMQRNNGLPPFVMVGKSKRWIREEVDAWIQQRRAEASNHA